jgi:hypothetical protein
MRRSVFYTMSQDERIGRLQTSNWPDLDWSDHWVTLTFYEDFDRSIVMDARSGKLQIAFEIPYGGPYDVEQEFEKTERGGDPIIKKAVKDWSKQWDLC